MLEAYAARPARRPGVPRVARRDGRAGRLRGVRRDAPVLAALPGRRTRRLPPVRAGARASAPAPGCGACSKRAVRERDIPVALRHARSSTSRSRRRPCDGRDRRARRRARRIEARRRRDPCQRELRGRPRATRHLPPAAARLGRAPGQHRRHAAPGARGRRVALAHERVLRLAVVRAPGLPGRVHARRPRPELHLRRRRRAAVRRRDRLGGPRPRARAHGLPAAPAQPPADARLDHLRRGRAPRRPAARDRRQPKRLRLEPRQLGRGRRRVDQARRRHRRAGGRHRTRPRDPEGHTRGLRGRGQPARGLRIRPRPRHARSPPRHRCTRSR